MKILIDDEYTDEARRLLKAGFHQRGHRRDNPVTGRIFAHGLDPIVWQIRDAAKALRVRARFAHKHPDLRPLPLSPREYEDHKAPPSAGGIDHALSMFGRSLAGYPCFYDIDLHPSFDDYVRGFLCSLRLREMFGRITDQFPPKALPGLVPGYSHWGRPDRSGYFDELVRANETGMPDWPEAWLPPERQHQADGIRRAQLREHARQKAFAERWR